MITTRPRDRRRVLLLVAVAICLLTALPSSQGLIVAVEGNSYYVDSVRGRDENPGTRARPWRSLARIEEQVLAPGDTVYLRRDSRWQVAAPLRIKPSGRQQAPITVTAYGEGTWPVISSAGKHGIVIEGDWIVLEELAVEGAEQAGILIDKGAEDNLVHLCEISNSGIGVLVMGDWNVVASNNIHDLHMVVNTPGGDDDYGANGVFVRDANHVEIAYNTMVRCIAPSYDYEFDGGAVELFGRLRDIRIHHNWAQDCDGFVEVGGRPGHVRDVTVSYNVIVDSERALHFNLGVARYAADVDDFVFDHNTVVEDDGWQAINLIGGRLSGDALTVRNNIFAGYHRLASSTEFVHHHNLYDTYPLLSEPGPSAVEAGPGFVDRDEGDYRLRSSSPAVDAGASLGYDADHDSQPVPVGEAPDIGAFERQRDESERASQAAEAPAALPSVTPAPTVTKGTRPDSILIDDSDAAFETGGEQDPWQIYASPSNEHHNKAHRYNRELGGGDYARWHIDVARPGIYDVYAWWPPAEWRPTDVPYTIADACGSTTVRRDQRRDGGRWVHLGAFVFVDEGSVTVTDEASDGRDIAADAVRLDWRGPLLTAQTSRRLLACYKPHPDSLFPQMLFFTETACLAANVQCPRVKS